MAATVYNKELVYQKKEFTQLLSFCELYAEQFSSQSENVEYSPSKKKRRKASSTNNNKTYETDQEYVVEDLLDIRVNNKGEKQVMVRWEGYLRPTWEPYESIKEQLPDMIVELEEKLSNPHNNTGGNEHNEIIHTFLLDYITKNNVSVKYRWSAEALNALEYESLNYGLPINETTEGLRKKIMYLVRNQNSVAIENQ